MITVEIVLLLSILSKENKKEAAIENLFDKENKMKTIIVQIFWTSWLKGREIERRRRVVGASERERERGTTANGWFTGCLFFYGRGGGEGGRGRG